MGVALTELVPTKPIAIADLSGKILAVDGYNILYQFLTTIRGPDGAPLTDSHGNVTSHLTGLFSRTTNLLAQGIKLVFVFDGTMPELKRKEIDRRRGVKEDAQAKFEVAKEQQDVDAMKKYAGRTSKLTREMVAQAKELLEALGVPCVDAPSEGEAQAAALVKQGHAWAVVSQDADALLYEAPRVIKNLAITGKRKQPGKLAYTSVEPELIESQVVLSTLNLNVHELRALALLVGTDYNIGGVKGIGPKKGLKLVQENRDNFAQLYQIVKWDEHSTTPWQQILDLFEHMPTIDPGKLTFGKVQEQKVIEILVEKHDFSRERISAGLQKLLTSQKNAQKGLGDFF